MQFKLNIELGNDAMQTHEDIAWMLRKVATELDSGTYTENGTVRDINGNTVGTWEVSS